MSEKRQPWMKWYPADWRQEPTLRLCSRGARSLWVDMLGLMHEAERYGLLMVSGRMLNERQLAAVLGDSEKDVRAWLAELEEAGVFSRDEDGTIFSRRMVRDKAREEENRRNGRSGGNPRLKAEDKGWDNKPDKGGVKAEVKGGDKAHIPEARSQKPDIPEPTGSGAAAPVADEIPDFLNRAEDLKKQVWGPCLSWLATETGKPPDALRSLVGKWVKAAGDGAVVEAIIACQRERPLAPIDWISAAIQQRQPERGKLTSAFAGIAAAGQSARGAA